MSKKGSDTPSSIRIRENQRRSRNQRKELIQDLQRRVQEYEAKGIAATQEMQRAARKVADENARLRSLLSSRGVAHEEIEAYLRSFDAASTPNHSSANRYALPVSRPPVLAIPAASSFGYMASPVSQARAPTPTQLPVQAPAQAVFQQPAHSPPHPSALAYTQSQDPRRSFVSTIQHAACDSEKENLATVTTPILSHEPSVVPDSKPPTCCKSAEPTALNYSRETDDAMLDHVSASSPGGKEYADCPNTTSCFCPPSSAPQQQSLDSGLLISCETAASIIAEMRGDGDRQRIRASLGCHGDKECSVKNTLVLELMDER
ncbi:hypothetical protein AA0117_g4202 [Alternaria alternata]|uniref:BZIP domain-containing protein n=1 Tax=Alternaria alternata TaxID=5599 RepID=A0A4Q4NKS1_ALTAL|nr:hypothetical protein AA0117_g4202 [Alternaria alternata]